MSHHDILLSEARLSEALGGRSFKFFPQVESTNDLAREWAFEGAATGSVVLTEEQTRGRGRFGRAWEAPPGTALLMSIILRPKIARSRMSRVTMVGAMAVMDVLGEICPGKLSLKWPNDVHLEGKKVAGVLPEATWQGDMLSAVILGIGLNVSIDFTQGELSDHAISITTVTQRQMDRADLLNKLLRAVDYWSLHIESQELQDRWRESLETLGKRITAITANGEITGQASDVDDEGALLLRTEDGTIHRVIAGEVTLAK